MLYVTHLLNGILMLAIPIGLGLYLTSRFQLPWRLWWIGAATFILSQLGHIPFNIGLDYIFDNNYLPSPPQSWRVLFNAAVLGLSAGLWEETFRYFTYRWWAKSARSWRTALLLGAGHGGVEAMLLGIIVIITYFQMLALQGVDPSSVAPPEQVDLLTATISQYWSLPWYSSLLGAIERIFALLTHLALSVLVWQVYRRAQSRWLWLAVGWHALVNAAALYAAQTWGAIPAEGILAGIALIDIAIIAVLRYPQEEPTQTNHQPPREIPQHALTLEKIDEIDENLDQTRYN